MTTKKMQVIMLPTNEKANEDKLIYRENKLMFQTKKEVKHDRKWRSTKHYHLYFLSDEKINEGDWCINPITKLPFEVKSIEKNRLVYPEGSKKIIATTDSSLGYEESIYDPKSKTGGKWIGLPQPSQEFIKYYVSEYNRGSIITEVLVKYEYRHDDTVPYPKTLDGKEVIVINPDNTINIKISKDSFSREEVKQLCWQAFIDHKCIDGKIKPSVASDLIEPFNKWIEENL